MPVRLTRNRALLLSYDLKSDSWISLEGMTVCVLSQPVEVEPGVTVQHIFDLIDREKALKRFLNEYCSCDLDAVRVTKCDQSDPIQLITGVEYDEDGAARPTGVAHIDQIVIVPDFYVFTDKMKGDRRLEGGYMLHGRSSEHGRCTMSLGGPDHHPFARLKNYELRLDPEMHVVESDEDQQVQGDEETIAFSANVQYTFFDVLTTIVGFFGDSAFDPRYQKQIDEEREMFERLNDLKQDDYGESDDNSPTTD